MFVLHEGRRDLHPELLNQFTCDPLEHSAFHHYKSLFVSGINFIILTSMLMEKLRDRLGISFRLNLSRLVSRAKPRVLGHGTCLDRYSVQPMVTLGAPGPCAGLEGHVMPQQPGRLEPKYLQGQLQEVLGSPQLGIQNTLLCGLLP